VLHKTAGGAVTSDDVGTGVTYYYWIRHVGTNGKRGSFATVANATTGKLTGSDEIANLTITNALIANLAVDNAKINDMAAGKLTAGTIGAHTIVLDGASSILKSSNYVANTSGWQIAGNGAAEFQNATIRGTLNATDITAGTLAVARLSAGSIDTEKFGDETVVKTYTSTGGWDHLQDATAYATISTADTTIDTTPATSGGFNVVPSGNSEVLFQMNIPRIEPHNSNSTGQPKIYFECVFQCRQTSGSTQVYAIYLDANASSASAGTSTAYGYFRVAQIRVPSGDLQTFSVSYVLDTYSASNFNSNSYPYKQFSMAKRSGAANLSIYRVHAWAIVMRR
jgi:hypothetical protein